jgi:hypothetical protein
MSIHVWCALRGLRLSRVFLIGATIWESVFLVYGGVFLSLCNRPTENDIDRARESDWKPSQPEQPSQILGIKVRGCCAHTSQTWLGGPDAGVSACAGKTPNKNRYVGFQKTHVSVLRQHVPAFRNLLRP